MFSLETSEKERLKQQGVNKLNKAKHKKSSHFAKLLIEIANTLHSNGYTIAFAIIGRTNGS